MRREYITKIGFISDAHGHLPAFKRGVDVLQAVGVDRLIFLGDAIGYIPDPGVVRLMRAINLEALQGNHEAMLQCSQSERDHIYQIARCRSQLTVDELDYLTSLPKHLKLQINGVEIFLCHGAPDDHIYGYVYPDTNLNCYDLPSKTIFVAGNTHRPMIRQSQGGAIFCNPGSCGMPRDTGELGAVGVLEVENYMFRVLRFDISEISNSWIRHCSPVHESVRELFLRRESNVIGEKIDQ